MHEFKSVEVVLIIDDGKMLQFHLTFFPYFPFISKREEESNFIDRGRRPIKLFRHIDIPQK